MKKEIFVGKPDTSNQISMRMSTSFANEIIGERKKNKTEIEILNTSPGQRQHRSIACIRSFSQQNPKLVKIASKHTCVSGRMRDRETMLIFLVYPTTNIVKTEALLEFVVCTFVFYSNFSLHNQIRFFFSCDHCCCCCRKQH